MSVWSSAAKPELLVHMVNTSPNRAASYVNCSLGMSWVVSVLAAARPVKTAPICRDTLCQEQLSPILMKVKSGQKVKSPQGKYLYLEPCLFQKLLCISHFCSGGAFPLRHFHICSSNKKLHANPWSQAESLLTFTSIHMPLSYLTTKHIQTTTQPSTARG